MTSHTQKKKTSLLGGGLKRNDAPNFLIQCLFQVLSPTVFGPQICSDVVAATAALLVL
jgi:hypothetical protein